MATITMIGTVCDRDHGGPRNRATFYGHPGRRDVCVRVGDQWVFDLVSGNPVQQVAPTSEEN